MGENEMLADDANANHSAIEFEDETMANTNSSGAEETFYGFEEESFNEAQDTPVVNDDNAEDEADIGQNDDGDGDNEDDEESEDEEVLRRSRRVKSGRKIFTYDKLGKDPKVTRYTLWNIERGKEEPE